MALDNDEEDNKELKMCMRSLVIAIANNTTAIIKLSNNALDYQSGILLRNTYELCFTFLAILIDKEKRKVYFDSAKNENEYEIWRKHFTFKKLNQTLINFEKDMLTDGLEISIRFSGWREEQYKHYSGYVHNNFIDCFLGCYNSSENEDDNMPLMLWGITDDSNRAMHKLIVLNDLLWWCGLYLLKILDLKLINKHHLCSEEQDMWNNSFSLFFMAEHLMLEYKKE